MLKIDFNRLFSYSFQDGFLTDYLGRPLEDYKVFIIKEIATRHLKKSPATFERYDATVIDAILSKLSLPTPKPQAYKRRLNVKGDRGE